MGRVVSVGKIGTDGYIVDIGLYIGKYSRSGYNWYIGSVLR